MRGYASQGWRAAGRALADSGISPVKAYGRFVAGEIYRPGMVAGVVYRGGVVAGQAYQGGIVQGQVQ